jgi:hypothetical protein
MPRRVLPPVSIVLLVLAVSPPARGAEPAGHRARAFNGTDLEDWEVTGCEAAVEDGALVLVSGNGLVRTQHRYRDFVLELEWRARKEKAWDSGIYFRSELPEPGKPWPERYQANLREGDEGNLVGVAAARSQGLVKAREWNALRLTVAGGRAVMEMNGKPAWAYDGIASPAGYIALQAEVPGGGQFEFREIYITEIGYESLLAPTGFGAWEGVGGEASACWASEDGILSSSGKGGPWLRTKKEHADFNLRLDYRLEPGGNSGIYVRVPEDGRHHGEGSGIEVQIIDDAAEAHRSLEPAQRGASLYKVSPATKQVGRPAGAWNSLEIDVKGRAYRVAHNGVTVVATDAERTPELVRRRLEGYLGLQNHGSAVRFRNLRVGPPGGLE